MELSAELKVPLDEVLAWDLDVFYDWLAFFKIMEDRQKKKRQRRGR